MTKKKQISGELGAPSEHLREQKAEDVQRIKNNLNRRTKKDKCKNPFLKKNGGGIDLIEIFPTYEKKEMIKNGKIKKISK